MTAYRCTECARPIGRMVDAKGLPDAFLCPHTSRPALAVEPGREALIHEGAS
jgi:hypothetical protein